MEARFVDTAPGAPSPEPAFGDAVAWFTDGERAFDPVTDVAVGGQCHRGPEWMAAVVEHCAQGLAALEAVDPSGFDAATTAAWALGVEQLRRQSAAASIAVADHVDATQPFRDQGFFTAKAWMKHHLQLSGSEAHGRVQEAKLRRAVRVWNHALSGGQVGVAQTRLMARIAANPRIAADTLAAGARELMIDAMDWGLHATFDDVGGPEFLEIFSWYVDREFDRDWKEATRQLGEGNVDVTKLCRTEAQRRSDALLEMARAAAACPPDRTRPLPTVNFLLDEATARAAADGDVVSPLDYRDVISRTDRGHRVDPNAIIGVSLWAMIRRVVTDSKGVVIDLGRTSRLFTGYAREAVMLLEPTCIWPGCDQPHSWCHADHLTSWSTRGPTDTDNGAPLCARHNSLKERGFTITRDIDGRWHITAPDGTIIC